MGAEDVRLPGLITGLSWPPSCRQEGAGGGGGGGTLVLW